VSLYLLLAFAVLLSVLTGVLLAQLWKRHEAREVERKWQERERLLDRRGAIASRREVLRRRSRASREAAMRRRRPRLPGQRQRFERR
jgi:hypothetical protein